MGIVSNSMARNTMNLSGYEINLKVLASGAQAKIVRGTHIASREAVAIKVFSLRDEPSRACFENEVCMLTLCRSVSNVIPTRCCFTHKAFGFLVMPFVEQDLLSHVMSSGSMDETAAAKAFYQICQAVDGCHRRGVSHLDIKPENVLYDEARRTAWLCDYGNSFFSLPGELVEIGRRGTLVYSSPEVKGDVPYDPMAADIWSLGIMLHVMVAGYFPHAQEQLDMQLYHEGHINLGFVQRTVSRSCYDLLSSILVIDPRDRPTIRSIMKHPWILEHTTVEESNNSLPSRISRKLRRSF